MGEYLPPQIKKLTYTGLEEDFEYTEQDILEKYEKIDIPKFCCQGRCY